MKAEEFSHHFLIAMPMLQDPNFAKAVIYLYEHTSEGAMGIIINKQLQINLGSVLRHLEITITDSTIETQPVLMGGPVRPEHGFVIHNTKTKDPDSREIAISASKDTLASIAEGKGPENFIIALGYAGWGAGQLEREINRNDWLIVPFNIDILFSTPIELRWEKTAKLLGVDINQLSDQIGHA